MEMEATRVSGEKLPSGVMVALATPLDERRQLDKNGLGNLLDHVLEHPITGICPVGSTGEGPLLTREVRTLVTAEVSRRVPAEIWNIPAAVSTTIDDVIEDIQAYSEAGANAVLVTVPFYYQLNAPAILNWYEEVVERSILPILIYNIPLFTKLSVPPLVVSSLAKHKQVIGMKDSSRDMEYFESIVGVTKDANFSLMTGSDTLLLASGLLGGAGAIAASTNIVPEIICALWDAFERHDWSLGNELQSRLVEIVSISRKYGFPAGWKAALSLAKVCSAQTAFPNIPLSGSVLQQFAAELAEVGILLQGGKDGSDQS